MASGKINNLLIPNVSNVPGKKKVDLKNKLDGQSESDEFKNLLKEKFSDIEKEHGISLSIHAAKRMKERNLDTNKEEMGKVKGAIERLRGKGGQDSLVITENAAYIVDVENNKIVTAMGREGLKQNVFTKIDSTVIM